MNRKNLGRTHAHAPDLTIGARNIPFLKLSAVRWSVRTRFAGREDPDGESESRRRDMGAKASMRLEILIADGVTCKTDLSIDQFGCSVRSVVCARCNWFIRVIHTTSYS